MADFLPDYSTMQTPAGRYLPMFRLFAGDRWHHVLRDKRPLECATASEAIRAAKDCVRRILNPTIRAEQIEAAPAVSDELAEEVQAFLAKREREAEAERLSVFGAAGPSTLFLKGGRQVKVEARKVRRVSA